MGEASSYTDVLLVVFPFPEPTALLDEVRQKFPEVRIEYFRVKQDEDRVSKSDLIPKGRVHLHWEIRADVIQVTNFWLGYLDVLAVTTILCTLHFLPNLEDVPRYGFESELCRGV